MNFMTKISFISLMFVFLIGVILMATNSMQKTEAIEENQQINEFDPCDLLNVDCVEEHEKADLFEASRVASEKWNVPYELMLGIAFAESSLGKNFVGCEHSFNAWGITPAGQEAEECNGHLRKYDNWIEGADDTARILRNYYFDEGLDTPEKIVYKYVGWNNQDWIKNVREFYN